MRPTDGSSIGGATARCSSVRTATPRTQNAISHRYLRRWLALSVPRVAPADKRCVRFIWESHLPLLHKLYVVVFFFSVRSTSIISNSLFFTLLMPAMMVLHYTRPELGVIVPWWSVLLLPMATTASVLVHTPRSFKYAVLYVLYENVLAMHKASASLEGMLGCARGFTWVVTDKTGVARRHSLSLRGVLRWAGRWRSKLFVRECMIGVYLCFSGAWLSSELRSLSLFWFYGVYMWMQGLIYLVFGTSLVDSLNFEPDLPEALRRPYRRQLAAAATPLIPQLQHRLRTARSASAEAARRSARQLGAPARRGSSLAAARVRVALNGSTHPGLPWQSKAAGHVRHESFVHVDAYSRVPTGSIVAGRRACEGVLEQSSGEDSHEAAGQCLTPSQIACCLTPRCDAKAIFRARLLSFRLARSHGTRSGRACNVDLAPVPTTGPSHHCAGDQPTALSARPPHSPPPSPPPCACSAAGTAALERTRTCARAVPSALPASGGGACLPPNVPMPTSAHVRACLRHAALSARQKADEASRQSFEQIDGPEVTLAATCSPPAEPQDATKSNGGESGRRLSHKSELQPWGARRAAAHPHQLLNVVPGAADVPIPRLRWRVFARCRSLVLSLPLWALNGLVAWGIGLLLSDLSRTQHAESWVCFIIFALLLPVLLIWAVGRPEANTKAAWASLKGDTPLHQPVLHFVQLLLMVCTFAAAVAMALFTSSGRINRWSKCRWPWMELGGTAGDSVSGLAEVRFFNVWQCGDPFFS